MTRTYIHKIMIFLFVMISMAHISEIHARCINNSVQDTYLQYHRDAYQLWKDLIEIVFDNSRRMFLDPTFSNLQIQQVNTSINLIVRNRLAPIYFRKLNANIQSFPGGLNSQDRFINQVRGIFIAALNYAQAYSGRIVNRNYRVRLMGAARDTAETMITFTAYPERKRRIIIRKMGQFGLTLARMIENIRRDIDIQAFDFRRFLYRARRSIRRADNAVVGPLARRICGQ